MNCLVLGGAGFLGSHICDALAAAGHSVRIFDRFEAAKTNIAHLLTPENAAHPKPPAELVQGDFGNASTVFEITRGIDVVYHLISTTLPKSSNDDMVFDVTSNVLPTLHLLDACRKNGVKKVIYASSGGTVYGVPTTTPISENHHTHPICSYGIHKITVEKYLHLYYSLFGLDYAVMRIANPYGERQRTDGAQGAVAVFLGKMLRGETIEIWGDGSVVRDYLYVGDVADAALALAAYSPGTDGEAARIFNIGGGHGLSLLQVVHGLGRALGKDPEVRFSPARAIDVPVNVLDISLAKKRLGWTPRTPFPEGLRKTVAAYAHTGGTAPIESAAHPGTPPAGGGGH
ncbi:MAG TPA: NAD-dependent epimerase/dehydratase family protein [Phycisphaerae bacterium]|nr:NAD-dependent epimerase/dehydratase family protein [Phycisphaerae bacterium]